MPLCYGNDRQACSEVDRALHEIDVALDQMMRQCTGISCKYYELDNLLVHAYYLAIASRALTNKTGWVRTRKNSYDNHNDWNRAGYCPTPPPQPRPSCTGPSDFVNPIFRQEFYITHNPYPRASACLTLKEANDKERAGATVERPGTPCAPKCPDGYQHQLYNGAEVCLRCPAGMNYKDNCCY